VRGCIFNIAACEDGEIVGVVIVGRPVARLMQNDYTAEVLRLCTDGSKNTCSFLYAAAWRAAKNIGYRRLITYILDIEPGTSLIAAGWKNVGMTRGGTWNRENRPRIDTHPTQQKIRFEVTV
jgi:hypothetical protein